MSFESPISVLYNANGSEIALSASQSISVSSQPGLMIMASGSNGTAQFFKLADDGALLVSGAFSFGGIVNASISNAPTVNQGTAGTLDQSWFVRISDGTQVLGTGSSAPVWVTGSVTTNVTPVATQSVYVGGWNTVAVTASVQELRSATAVLSSTLASSGLVGYSLLTSNSSRKGATFFLEGNRVAYLKLGTGANTNSFSIKMTNNSYWEIPFNYTGDVTVSFNSGSQVASLYQTDLT